MDMYVVYEIMIKFDGRRDRYRKLIAFINNLPNSFNIARRWNINDHKKRVEDRSITYDYFNVSKDKVEYSISKCMYVEMFETYGIRGYARYSARLTSLHIQD